jgi:hypothetical protein
MFQFIPLIYNNIVDNIIIIIIYIFKYTIYV